MDQLLITNYFIDVQIHVFIYFYAVTQHTTSFWSVQVIDITLMKVSFHKYYIPQSSTIKTSRVRYYTLNITNEKCTKTSRSSSVQWGFS
jgi:hypothetical protein